tara:strand:+ start:961 stop:1668 length:708 start_codon:yes stop_codon:yes gene_type:complete
MYIQFLVFITTFLIGIILYFACSFSVSINTFNSNKPGLRVLLVGGTHGNEPSGSHSLLILQNLLKKGILKLKSGKITIIHNVNPCGYYFDNRHYSVIGKKMDLNRMYNQDFPINKKIEKLVNKHDLVLDFHEGWGYIGQQKGSIGSSITCLNIPFKQQKQILDLLNKDIKESDKKWLINDMRFEVDDSLREYAMLRKKKYMLIETTGQKNIQPLHLRIKQNNIITTYLLKKYGVL